MRFLFSFLFSFFGLLAIYCEANLHTLSHRSSPQSERERERERSSVRSHESIDRAQFKVSPKGTSPVQNFEKPSPPPLFLFFFPSLHHLTPYTTTKPHSDNPSSPNPNSTPQTYNFSPNTSHYPHYSNTSLPPPTPAISTEAVQV